MDKKEKKADREKCGRKLFMNLSIPRISGLTKRPCSSDTVLGGRETEAEEEAGKR